MVVSKLAMFAAECQRLGPLASLRRVARAAHVKLDMVGLAGLRLLFGFERWHARSPDSARPYRKQLAALVNGLDPCSVVEVGCGLGGVVSQVKAESRLGFDRDSQVIRAARLLHGHSMQFAVGGFEQLEGRNIDVLIAVNWMHEFPPKQIEQWIEPLLPTVRYLLIDSVILGSPGDYKYFHDFGFLENKATRVSIDVETEPNRCFILWQVIH